MPRICSEAMLETALPVSACHLVAVTRAARAAQACAVPVSVSGSAQCQSIHIGRVAAINLGSLHLGLGLGRWPYGRGQWVLRKWTWVPRGVNILQCHVGYIRTSILYCLLAVLSVSCISKFQSKSHDHRTPACRSGSWTVAPGRTMSRSSFLCPAHARSSISAAHPVSHSHARQPQTRKTADSSSSWPAVDVDCPYSYQYAISPS